jgi:hypothetical protein
LWHVSFEVVDMALETGDESGMSGDLGVAAALDGLVVDGVGSAS